MQRDQLPPELLLPPKRRIIRNRQCFNIGPVTMQIVALFNPILWFIPGIFSGQTPIDSFASLDSQIVRMIAGWSCVLFVVAVEMVIWLGDLKDRQLAESGRAIMGRVIYLSPGYGRGAPHAIVKFEGGRRTIGITGGWYKLLQKEQDSGAEFEPILVYGRYINFYRFHPYHCTLPEQTS